MKPDRLFGTLGALSAFVSVAAGAFAAHGLRQKYPPEQMAVFETGVRYQMYHAVALLVAAWAAGRWPVSENTIEFSGWLFVAGTLLFSGSLYVLALTGIRWLGGITPFGGLMLLLGWLTLARGIGSAGD